MNPISRRHDNRRTWLALGAIVIYLALLMWRYDSLPPSLNADAAGEIESGYRLVHDRHFTVLTFEPSKNGVESLWVAMAGVFVSIFGHSTFPAVMSSWLAVVIMLLMLVLIARRSAGRIDPLIIVLTATSMVWLFHYGRVAMRCISSATFISASMLGMLIFLSDNKRRWRGPILLGGSLALGIYSYTTSRVPPVAYALFMIGHLALVFVRYRSDFKLWLIQHLRTIGVALVVSIPNIVYAAQYPKEFFARGMWYNLHGGWHDWMMQVIDSLAVPIVYDFDRYRGVGGRTWLFDPAAAALPVAVIPPVWLVVGFASFVGLIWISLKWRGPMLGAAIFGLMCYVLTCAMIGFTGPSLSRISLNIPLIALAGAAILSVVAKRLGKVDWIAIGLCLLTVLGVYRYERGLDDELVRSLFSVAVRDIATEATERSKQGQTAYAILRRDAGVMDYYSRERKTPLYTTEFFNVPFELSRLSKKGWDESDVIFIERAEQFDEFVGVMRASDEFVESPARPRYFVFERARAMPTN